MRTVNSYLPSTFCRSTLASRTRYAFFVVIGLRIVLGVTGAYAAENADSTPLRLLVVPVGTVMDVDSTVAPDFLSAAVASRRPFARFPRLPAVNVTGYNVAVLHRLHADVAAKLTVGVETHRPVAAEQTSAAVGLGLEFQF